MVLTFTPLLLLYRLVQKKGTVLLSTSLAWPAVGGCSRAETFSQLSSLSFAQPCIRNGTASLMLHVYRDRRQDVAEEMERN